MAENGTHVRHRAAQADDVQRLSFYVAWRIGKNIFIFAKNNDAICFKICEYIANLL
jgi:hypothetical protein